MCDAVRQKVRKTGAGQRLTSASRNFLRSVLRSGKILMQDCAILRNALRKRNYESPGVSNAVQSSETLRNSLGLNYKSAALSGGAAEVKARRSICTSRTDSLPFGKRRYSQFGSCSQNSVLQLVTLRSICNEYFFELDAELSISDLRVRINGAVKEIIPSPEIP